MKCLSLSDWRVKGLSVKDLSGLARHLSDYFSF